MSVLQGGRARRRRSHAGRRSAARALAILILAGVALLAVMDSQVQGPATIALKRAPTVAPHVKPVATVPQRGSYGIAPAPANEQVAVKLKLRLRSGLLFDVNSGRVLWQRDPTRPLPIASLTKMMTALVVSARAKPSDRVLITRD